MKFSRVFIFTIITASLAGCGPTLAEQQAMQQRQQRQIATASLKARMDECTKMNDEDAFKTKVAYAKCVNANLIAIANLNNGYMDLINLLTAKTLEVAEKVDQKKITETQGKLEVREYAAKINEMARQRNLENAQMQLNEQAAAAQGAMANAALIQSFSNLQQSLNPQPQTIRVIPVSPEVAPYIH